MNHSGWLKKQIPYQKANGQKQDTRKIRQMAKEPVHTLICTSQCMSMGQRETCSHKVRIYCVTFAEGF